MTRSKRRSVFSYFEWHGEIICSIYEQYLERVDRFERMAVAINLRQICAAIPSTDRRGGMPRREQGWAARFNFPGFTGALER